MLCVVSCYILPLYIDSLELLRQYFQQWPPGDNSRWNRLTIVKFAITVIENNIKMYFHSHFYHNLYDKCVFHIYKKHLALRRPSPYLIGSKNWPANRFVISAARDEMGSFVRTTHTIDIRQNGQITLSQVTDQINRTSLYIEYTA